jgi:hypothetical protein
MLAGIQRVEIGNAVDAEDHGFAVDYEMPTAVLERGLDDSGVSAAPVVAVACKQPNAVAFMVNDQVETVVFDFVNPFRAGRDLGAARRDGGLELLASEICRGRRIATSARLSALVARHRRVAGLTKQS